MTAARLDCPEQEFTLRLRERLPMNVCFTFTSEQLEALRRVFGERLDGHHEVDMRGRLHLPWTRYYIVLQLGRDRRENVRRQGNLPLMRTLTHSALCFLPLAAIAAWATWLIEKLLG